MDRTLIDPLLLKVSDGKLIIPQKVGAERTSENPSMVRVSLENDPNLKRERLNDALLAMSYTDVRFSPISPTALQRSDREGSFAMPKALGTTPFSNSPTHLFLFMVSADGEEYSGSCAF